MTPTQLRQALKELNGERHAIFAFAGMSDSVHHEGPTLKVEHAMLIPDEPDHLVKVTDGKSVFIIDAERVAWIRIGLK
ncbi:MAG: hypothetical protein GC200_12475 [Tepidisphaera sp.]|nr:hypothetical protein [Tepidisphaera sp.]